MSRIVIPSSFDPNDTQFRAVELPKPSCWEGEELLRHFSSRGLMMRTPIFWQWGFSLHAACRNVGIPIFVNEPENMPVGAQALLRGGIDTIVTENSDAPAFASYLQEKQIAPPAAWILIHRAAHTDWSVAAGVLDAKFLAQEVHILPGLPALRQCPLLAQTRMPHFHTVAVPIELPPIELTEVGTCACGKTIVERV